MGKLPENYIVKGYAALVGKVIGVRLGAPVESWTYESIERQFGEVEGYLANYVNFASDDDLNGPLFFYRALTDYGLDASEEAMGKTLLNYVPFEHGFFWWGGYGTSTEHTAYANLRGGIPAPVSGSIAQNGPVVAQQIGGQIFSDCWGFVCPGNPALAAEYARRASSATHDGEGLYGGMFVAACVAAAYTAESVEEVIRAGLAQVPDDCLYTRMTRDIMAYYRAHPDNWRECFTYIKNNWGYDHFPGAVHIIPNAAIMILALCYGEGKFGKTLCICNMCGWDTDCNVGNLGAVMGALVGLEGIEAKWLEPLCDFLAASSVVGSLNNIDIANASIRFSKLACEIAGETLPEIYNPNGGQAAPSAHFELPGSLHAFRVDGHITGGIENTEEYAHTGHRSLKLQGHGEGDIHLYQKTYYVPSDFSDSRYDPAFSPTAYPGAVCTAFARSASGPVSARLAAWRRGGEELCSSQNVLLGTNWQELTLNTSSAPKDSTLFAVGLVLDGGQGMDMEVYMDDFTISSDADYTIDFSKEQTESWNRHHKEVSQLTRLGGIWQLLDGALWGGGVKYCRAYTGHYDWQDYTITAQIVPQQGEAFRLLGRVQGAERSYSAAIRDGSLWIEKQDGDFKPIAFVPFAFTPGETVDITLTMRGGKITASIGDAEVTANDPKPYRSGCMGWAVEKGRMKILKTSVKTDMIDSKI